MTRASHRAQDVALVLFCLLAIRSCFGSPYPRDQILQHTPTALFVLVMLATRTRFRLSTPAFVGVLTFMTLHVLGARYIYSYVPYDDWSRELFGTSISAQFGFIRNHYDRLVHFSFGLCLAYPVLEIMRRARMAREPWTYYFAVECILAAAMLYELANGWLP